MARISQDTPTVAHSVSAPMSSTPNPLTASTVQASRPSTTSPTHAQSNVGYKLSDPSITKRHLTPRIELTGATAAAENARHEQELSRQAAAGTSANPAHNSLFAAMSQPMSKAGDAPPNFSMSNPSGLNGNNVESSTKPSEPAAEAPTNGQSSENIHHSPQPMHSNVFATPNSSHQNNVSAADASDRTADGATSRKRALSPSSSPQEPSPTYSTYPPLSAAIANPQNSRNSSLPNVGAGGKSSTGKKHRCPHCSTEFTRHHNLKSHLLTHSQEKPYGCSQCDARFRRLHDLKRHLKLHTGERPHVCDICRRAFARGDALARHNKGPGGCAGRRESGVDEDDLEGIDDADDMEEDDPSLVKEGGSRRQSEPNKRLRRGSTSTRPPSTTTRESNHGSTYPPVAPLSGSTHAYYPQMSGLPSSSATRFNQVQYHQAPSMYGHGGMTESPKPLSPGQPDPRHRGSDVSMVHSPSISTRMQQHSMLRSNTGAGTPPPASQVNHQPLPSIQTGDSRFLPPSGNRLPPPILSTQNAQSGGHHSGPPSAGLPSASSHHQSSGGSMREAWSGALSAPSAPPADQRLLDYIRDMSEKVRAMEHDRAREKHEMEKFREEVDRMRSENDVLRQQLHLSQPQGQSQTQQQHQHQQMPPPQQSRA